MVYWKTKIHVLFPLESKMDKDTISMYFSQFGKDVSCTIPINKVLNRPKNFCFVKFNERECVLKALNKKQHKYEEKLFLWQNSCKTTTIEDMIIVAKIKN